MWQHDHHAARIVIMTQELFGILFIQHPPGESDNDESGGENRAAQQSENGEQEDSEEEQREEEENHMLAPEGTVAMHHEELAEKDSDSDDSGQASSGQEDVESEIEEDDMATSHEAISKEDPKAAASGMAKPKLYDQSPEWQQLQKLQDDKGVTLLWLPPVIGAGVNRHPAKSFWSARYPGQSTKSVSWGTARGRSPIACLVKCIKRVLKQHMVAEPNHTDVPIWKNQMKALDEID